MREPHGPCLRPGDAHGHLGATAFLLGEYTPDEVLGRAEFAVADGVLQLASDRRELTSLRELEVLKLRGMAYVTGRHFFEIDRRGFLVYPRVKSPEMETDAGSPPALVQLSTGIAGLDRLFGGGIPRLSNTLVQGATGTGKTLLSLQFLLAGAKNRERGTLFTLEETADQVRSAAASVGWDQTTRLVDREQQLRGTARFREEFIGVVGHDLRNPLAAIRTGMHLLMKRATLDARDTALVQRLSSSADRMSRMIEDLLDFTRGRLGGGIPLRRSFVDLSALCTDVVEEMQTAHGRRVSLECDGRREGFGTAIACRSSSRISWAMPCSIAPPTAWCTSGCAVTTPTPPSKSPTRTDSSRAPGSHLRALPTRRERVRRSGTGSLLRRTDRVGARRDDLRQIRYGRGNDVRVASPKMTRQRSRRRGKALDVNRTCRIESVAQSPSGGAGSCDWRGQLTVSHLSPAALSDTIRLLEARAVESDSGEILETAEGRERKLET